MAYTLTPAERRARARERIQARENSRIRQRYTTEQKALESQQLQQQNEQNDIESQNFLTRGLATIGDLAANVITGAVKGLEGIVDLGVGAVGAVGGIFSEDFQKGAQDIISYDWTSETIGNPLQELTKYSYTNNNKIGEIIEGVASGVGQMLPAVVVSVATGGLGAPAAVAQAASLATMGASAAGNSTEQAYKDGADYWQGLGYGVASGAVETATEKMFGGLTKGLTGAGYADNLAKSLSKEVAETGVKRIAKGAIEEGIEEMAAEVANPALKAIYKGTDAFSDYGNAEYWKGVGEAGVTGALTSLAYSGTVGYGLAKAGKGYVGKEADINESLSANESIKRKLSELESYNKLTEQNELQAAQSTRANYQNIEKILKSVNETKRGELIKKFSLDKAFNPDGSMSEVLTAQLNVSEQQPTDGTNGVKKPITGFKKASYSVSMRGSENVIQNDLDRLNEQRVNAYAQENGVSVEEASKNVEGIKVFDGEFSQKGQQNFTKTKKALNYLNKLSGSNVSFVVVNENDTFNGTIVDGRTIYIGADTFENDTWAGTLVHEYLHYAEGTQEYAKLVNFLASDVSLWTKASSSVFGNQGYGFDSDKLSDIAQRLNQGQSVTAEEGNYYANFYSEASARMSEYLLGNETFIDNIVRKDAPLAEKIIGKIQDLKAALERAGTAEAQAEYKKLRKAENLYLKAAQAAGKQDLVRKIIKRRDEKIDQNEKKIRESKSYKKEESYGENIDEGGILYENEVREQGFDSDKTKNGRTNGGHLQGNNVKYSLYEIQYNRKTPYVQWKSDALAWANSSRTKIGDMDSGSDSHYIYFYEAIDPDDNGRATDYRVVAKVSLTNEKLINKWYAEVKANNEKNHASVYERVDGYEHSTKEYNSDNSTFVGEYSRDERVGKVYQGKPASDGKRNTQKGNGDSQRVKYSLENQYNIDKIQYSRNVAKYITYSKVGADNIRFIRSQLSKLYEGVGDSVADGIAIERDNTIYIVDSGKENGEIRFGIRKRINLNDTELRQKSLEDINDRAISKGFVSDELFEKIRHSSNNDSRSNIGRKLQEKLSVDTRESKNNKGRISNEDANSGREIKHSLKESNGKILTEDDKVIKAGMSEQERYEILKDRSINNIPVAKELSSSILKNLTEISSWEDINKYFGSEKKKIIRKLAEEFGVFDKEFFNQDIELEFEFSKRNFNESYGKQKNQFAKFAKMFSVFDKIVEKAIGIEVHNRNEVGYKVDETLKNVYVLISAFEDGGSIVPVKLEVKEFLDKKNTLYVAIALESIKKDEFSRQEVAKGVAQQYRPSSTISIYDLLRNVNPKDESFYKYIPKQFFESENSDILYSLKEKSHYKKRDISEITQQDYKHHAWAVLNGILSQNETGKFLQKIGEKKLGTRFQQTLDGLYMIPVGQEIAENTIVFTDGDWKSPSIKKVIKIQSNNGYFVDEIKEVIYEYEKRGLQVKTAELFYVYHSKDYEFAIWSKERRGSVQDNPLRGGEQDGRGTFGEIEGSLKFSRKTDGTSARKLSEGQIKKRIANFTQKKSYSKIEAEQGINSILNEFMSFNERYGSLIGKSKAEAVDMFWKGLNTAEAGKRGKVALEVAEYIINHAMLENIYADANNEAYAATINVLKPYLHSINLDGIKGEIKSRYGKDNSPYALWGQRKKNRLGTGEVGHVANGPDVIAQHLEEEGFYIDAINPAEIFFYIDDAYRVAAGELKKQTTEMLEKGLSKEELAQLKKDIVKKVLNVFTESGKPSQLSKIIDSYREKAQVWKDKYYEEKEKNKVVNRLLDKVQKIKDVRLGTYQNASQFKADIFKKSIEQLANIKNRGNINKSGTRRIIAGLYEWYTVKDNPMLAGRYDDNIAAVMEVVSQGKGDLNVEELKSLEYVVDYFRHFLENYNKVYRQGKWVDALPIVENYIDILHENEPVKVGWVEKNLRGYLENFAEPMTVVRYMDKYENGFYTEMLENIRSGAFNANIQEMELRESIDEFLHKHKNYLEKLLDATVVYEGKTISRSQAMLLYMTLNREQALAGLAESGFTIISNDEKRIRFNGFAPGEQSLDVIKEKASAIQKDLSKQFCEADKQYISIAEKLFNEDCKKLKEETDMERRGYSNVLEGYYVPIRRSYIARSVDTSTLFDEINRVSNASFNKDTVKGAKNELFIEGLDMVLDRHIHAIAQYANLALAIDEFDILFNLDVSGNPNKPISVKTEGHNTWMSGEKYLRDIVSDVQGIQVKQDVGDKFTSKVRSSYAKSVLGLNPKTWVTQLSSLFAANSILDADCIVRGFGVSAKDIDEFSKLAKLRNYDNTAAMAQGNLDNNSRTGKVLRKIDKFGDLLMKPIGMVDRFVVQRLFGACQVQVEKNEGLKVGTKANKEKAKNLLEKVILETQQNSIATERSAAMRSKNELARTITMFSSDAMKVVGRFIDSVGELSVLKAKRKATTDAKKIAELDKRIAAAKKKLLKSSSSILMSAVFMAVIAQLFKKFYNTDDEEENVAVNITVDAIGNMIGGLPILKEIYSMLAQGYEVDSYSYSAINDILSSVSDVADIASGAFQGDLSSRDIASKLRKAFYAAGQLLGIPAKNMYKVIYGLINTISPSTAYGLDSMFYNQSYRSDLEKAIEAGDEDMIATIAGIMLDENVGGIDDSNARQAIDELVKEGYDVIPRAVGDKITYDGEEIELTGSQKNAFKKVYYVANEALSELTKMSQYTQATKEVQAKAVNFIYDTYYNLALENLLRVDLENKNTLFAEAIDIEKLALIISMARTLTADTDKNGKVVNGSKKIKIQSYIGSLKLTAAEKYMIMGYLGYTNMHGESQVKSYINRLSLTKGEKETLLAYSGYEK